VRIRPFVTALLVGMVSAACQDLPTLSEGGKRFPGGSVEIASISASSSRRASSYVCYVSERTPDGPNRYRYGRIRLRFPASALAPDGATMIYRYRLMEAGASPGAEPVAAANCRIPRTPEAVLVMERRFAVENRRKRSSGGGGDGDSEIGGIRGCVSDGVCPIEGLVAIGYLPPSSGVAGGTCWQFGCGGWDASYSYFDNGTGGQSWDPGEPCNLGNAFLDDPQVNAGFQSLWDASNFSANLAQRREQFGWVIRTATGYRIQSLGSGNFCGWDGFAVYPPEGPDAIVGFIHTHPYSDGETILACDENGEVSGSATYRGTPSKYDRDMSVQLGQSLNRSGPLAGIILDADGIRGFSGWDSSLDSSNPRCGY